MRPQTDSSTAVEAWYNRGLQANKNAATMLVTSCGLAESLRRTYDMVDSTRLPSFCPDPNLSVFAAVLR
jgi:hypothetical protein